MQFYISRFTLLSIHVHTYFNIFVGVSLCFVKPSFIAILMVWCHAACINVDLILQNRLVLLIGISVRKQAE